MVWSELQFYFSDISSALLACIHLPPQAGCPHEFTNSNSFRPYCSRRWQKGHSSSRLHRITPYYLEWDTWSSRWLDYLWTPIHGNRRPTHIPSIDMDLPKTNWLRSGSWTSLFGKRWDYLVLVKSRRQGRAQILMRKGWRGSHGPHLGKSEHPKRTMIGKDCNTLDCFKNLWIHSNIQGRGKGKHERKASFTKE